MSPSVPDPTAKVRWLVPVTDGQAAAQPARSGVTVVVPVFNEEAVIVRSLEAICAHLDALAHRFRYDVVVVDDGSIDATRALVDEFAAVHPQVQLVVHDRNLRLGQALRTGFAASGGDYVVTVDADLSYAVEHITALLDRLVATGADIVLASPYAPGGETRGVPWRREALSRAANRYLGAVAQGHLHTLTGMVRAYRGSFIRALDLKAVDVDVNTEILYKAQVLRARIEEIPAVLDWRALAERRLVSGAAGRARWAMAKQLLSGFLFRPFLFFGVPGLVAVIAAVIVAVAGSALAAGFLVVLGAVLLVAAVLSLQAKRYFEELFHLGTTLHRQLRGE